MVITTISTQYTLCTIIHHTPCTTHFLCLFTILGRKSIFIATAALIIIGSLGSACAVDTPMLTIYGQGRSVLHTTLTHSHI
ncbi:hypothetical protein EON63_14215 [archaeon]|nr:MAG: hypothetical protein EON63_14215 [archaeon]